MRSKEREKEIDNAPLIFSDYATEQREKRYYAIQYCKLVLWLVLESLFFMLFGAILYHFLMH